MMGRLASMLYASPYQRTSATVERRQTSDMKPLPLQHLLKTSTVIIRPAAERARYSAQQRIQRKIKTLFEDSGHDSSSARYTRTGRISKARKGLKVHQCHCGRSYTRAEHLQRHQKNHAQEDPLVCGLDGCDRVFYNSDLLQQHRNGHRENNITSSQAISDVFGDATTSTGRSQTPSAAAAHNLFPIPFQSRQSAVAKISTKAIEEKVRNAGMFLDYSQRKGGPFSRVNRGTRKRVHYTLSQDNTASQVQCIKTQLIALRQEHTVAARDLDHRILG
ncbi:hypothetical protein BKA63DRAFT_4873 [Paraphoma chrysanthemicola]|nr:hypothetical protein BKA63DRAFT_4873 [Paraphoma chrysanthemicola]